MDIRDKSVVSSGIYERCFEQDGILYHHLLNPKTGYPYDNGLIAVTIISDKSVDGDALSTTCFALGLEDGMKLAESLDDVQAFFVTSDYEIHYTKDFRKKIKVTETEQKSIIHEANKVRRTNVQIALALSNVSLYNKDMNSIKDSTYTTQEKLQILADAAKYDVACTSSGSSRRGKKGELGNAEACGICHSFAADGRCISLLKILMTNHCAYDLSLIHI